MRPPHFDLKQVKRLAEEERFALGHGPACVRALEVYLHGEIASYRSFAQAVIRELDVGDFSDSKRIPAPDGPWADEYGIQLPKRLLEEFEVGPSTWYVKVTIQQNRKGQALFFMSLHPLAYEMNERNGGPLRPTQ